MKELIKKFLYIIILNQISVKITIKQALYYAGYFWNAVNRSDKAKEYLDRGLKQNDSFNEVIMRKKIKSK